jgi:hypothetical protein
VSRSKLDVGLTHVCRLPRCEREKVGESGKRTEYSHYLDTILKMDFQLEPGNHASVSPSGLGTLTSTPHRFPSDTLPPRRGLPLCGRGVLPSSSHRSMTH